MPQNGHNIPRSAFSYILFAYNKTFSQ